MDLSGGSCSFDSMEFIDIMEWLKSIDEREVDVTEILGFGETIPLIYESEINSLSEYVRALI